MCLVLDFLKNLAFFVILSTKFLENFLKVLEQLTKNWFFRAQANLAVLSYKPCSYWKTCNLKKNQTDWPQSTFFSNPLFIELLDLEFFNLPGQIMNEFLRQKRRTKNLL